MLIARFARRSPTARFSVTQSWLNWRTIFLSPISQPPSAKRALSGKLNRSSRLPNEAGGIGLVERLVMYYHGPNGSAEAKVLFGLANAFRLRTDQRDMDGLWPTHGEVTERLGESLCGRKIRWLASPTAASRQTAGIRGARIRRLLQ